VKQDVVDEAFKNCVTSCSELNLPMADDWFRNSEWNEEVEKFFFEKLRRARNKDQYLRIQASTLAAEYPRAALMLLEKYFELDGPTFDVAQAFVDQARAYSALGKLDSAVSSYQNALQREREFPQQRTLAYLEFPEFVLRNRLRDLYDAALQVLDTNSDLPFFPIDHFRWNSSYALIALDLGRFEAARKCAQQAFEAAQRKYSGAANHPNLGLVSDTEAVMLEKIETILKSN
jgi:tetratricopeptide (TPR) repeat protein